MWLGLFFLALLFSVGFGATSVAFFYANKPPSYMHYPASTDLRRRSATLPNITKIKVHVYERDIATRTVPFNATLQSLFDGWQKCSKNQFFEPTVAFEATKTICYKMGTQVADATNHIYLDGPGCARSSGAIGEGLVGGRESIIYDTSYWNNPRLVAHELGHNMGLYHAARNGDEYGDPTCAMGPVDNYIDSQRLCFNAPHLISLGWANSTSLQINDEKILSSSSPFYNIDEIYYVHYLELLVYVYKRSDPRLGADTDLIAVLQDGIQDINTDAMQLHFVPQTFTLSAVEKGTFPKHTVINVYFLLPLVILMLGIGVFFYRT